MITRARRLGTWGGTLASAFALSVIGACGVSYEADPPVVQVPPADASTEDGAVLSPEDSGMPERADAGDTDANPSDASIVDPLPLLGTGRDGPLTRGAASGSPLLVVPNDYSRIAADVGVNATSVMLEAVDKFAVGDLIMLWNATGLIESGDMSTLVDLSASPVGQWQLHRITAKTNTTVSFTPATSVDHPAASAQAIRIPEYTSVNLLATANLVARPWDGRTGGIVAFLAQQDVTLATGSTVSAYAAGFRGGPDDSYAGAAPFTCPAADGLPANGYAPKGEGLIPARYSATQGGSPAHGNGGGGGACHNAGGGGGGNGSIGGRGGTSFDSDGQRDVGGRGGARVVFSAQTRLVMGGGGGAGEANTAPTAAGASGGGVVFVRARSFTGTGSLLAGGNNGAAAWSGAVGNGGSGGGAGGTIFAEATVGLTCGGAQAQGGNGGAAYVTDSPGGGGGGGHIRLVAPTRSCPTLASSGVGGTLVSTPGGAAAHGAQPAAPVPGVVE